MNPFVRETASPVDLETLVTSLHHTPRGARPNGTWQFFLLLKDYWNNASNISAYAQRYADPYGDDDISEAAAAVIAESARLKMELIGAVIPCAFPKALRIRYTQRALNQYERLRDAAARFGAQIDPHWGLILPCQL